MRRVRQPVQPGPLSLTSRCAGTAHVSRCTRPFTTAQNCPHACASSAKLP